MKINEGNYGEKLYTVTLGTGFDWKFYPEMRDEIGFKPMDHLTKKQNQKIN